MPEMTFRVQWPDGTQSRCYSPSLVVRDHLTVGRAYPLAEFVHLARTALAIASDRVYAKHGFHCTSAAAQLEQIERTAAAQPPMDAAAVTVLGFDD